MKHLLTAFAICLSIRPVAAQEASLKLVSTAGQYIQNASGSISFSIGEPVIGTIGNASFTINQGFQQGDASQQCTISGFNPFSTNLNSKLDSLQLDAGNGYTKYAWNTGATTQSIHVKYSGTYRVTVTNAAGCIASDSVFVQFPDTVGIYIPQLSATCNQQVDVPVKVESFRNMLTMQGSINWNPAQLRFDSIRSYGPAQLNLNKSNFGTTQSSSGRISFSWNDSKSLGVSLADTTTVFTIRFTVLSTSVGQVPINFADNPTPVQFTDAKPSNKTWYSRSAGINVTCELTLNGRVLTPNDRGVRNVRVTLTGGSSPQTAVTDTLGNYSFKVLPGSYTLTPAKTYEQNKTNGISTLDIALIQSHILLKTPLNAAYKVIAGDVNNSSSISTSDILDLRRLILGTDTTLPNNRIWAFVDGEQTFSNIVNPFPFNSTKTFTNLSGDISHTFRGVKIGDVNYDRNPMLDQAPSGDTLRLYYDWSETPDGSILVSLKSRPIEGILGYQTGLKWDAEKLELEGILSNTTGIGIGERWKDEGYLTLSWNDVQARGLNHTDSFELLQMKFRKTQRLDRTVLKLDTDKIQTEAFNSRFQSVGVRLTASEIKSINGQGLLRIFPNPASREVNVEWRNERRSEATIRLLDATGRVVYIHRGFYEAGVQRHLIHKDRTATGAGSYIVQVESGGRILNGTLVTVNQDPQP